MRKANSLLEFRPEYDHLRKSKDWNKLEIGVQQYLEEIFEGYQEEGHETANQKES